MTLFLHYCSELKDICMVIPDQHNFYIMVWKNLQWWPMFSQLWIFLSPWISFILESAYENIFCQFSHLSFIFQRGEKRSFIKKAKWFQNSLCGQTHEITIYFTKNEYEKNISKYVCKTKNDLFAYKRNYNSQRLQIRCKAT